MRWIKVFKLVYKNKKGITLVELLITITILGLVIPLAGQILYSLTNFFNMASYRWDIQSAVRFACQKLETQSDLIVNSYEADILYDPFIAAGITVTSESPFTFEWRKKEIPANEEFDENKTYDATYDSQRNNPYVTPAEGAIDENDFYTYIFSTPAYDTNGNYLGTYMFNREYKAENSTLFLYNEGFGTVPVNVKFSFVKPDNDSKYLKHTIHFDFASGLEHLTNYSVETEFVLINTEREINATRDNKNARVWETEWLNGNNQALRNAGPAGWVLGYPNPGDATDRLVMNYTVQENGTDRGMNTEVYTLKKHGNVLRFISPNAFHDKTDVSGGSNNFVLASCLSDYTFSGLINSEIYLDNLRLFRDNVLRGTEFGDWFIHQYYYEWSPFLIEHTAFLKPVYQAILIPVSYVCEFIARL